MGASPRGVFLALDKPNLHLVFVLGRHVRVEEFLLALRVVHLWIGHLLPPLRYDGGAIANEYIDDVMTVSKGCPAPQLCPSPRLSRKYR